MHIKRLGYSEFKEHYLEIKNFLSVSYESNIESSTETRNEIVEIKINELKEYIQTNRAIVLGAFFESELVAFVWLYVRNHFDEKRLHVNHIVVKSNYREKGLAKKLMIESENIAKELGIEIIDLMVSESNDSALKLYKKNGFFTERRSLIKKI